MDNIKKEENIGMLKNLLVSELVLCGNINCFFFPDFFLQSETDIYGADKDINQGEWDGSECLISGVGEKDQSCRFIPFFVRFTKLSLSRILIE